MARLAHAALLGVELREQVEGDDEEVAAADAGIEDGPVAQGFARAGVRRGRRDVVGPGGFGGRVGIHLHPGAAQAVLQQEVHHILLGIKLRHRDDVRAADLLLFVRTSAKMRSFSSLWKY